MHNPALIGIPRPLPLPLPPFGRHMASDYIPIDVTHQHPPPIYLSHRQPSRYRTHHAFSGNQVICCHNLLYSISKMGLETYFAKSDCSMKRCTVCTRVQADPRTRRSPRLLL